MYKELCHRNVKNLDGRRVNIFMPDETSGIMYGYVICITEWTMLCNHKTRIVGC